MRFSRETEIQIPRETYLSSLLCNKGFMIGTLISASSTIFGHARVWGHKAHWVGMGTFVAGLAVLTAYNAIVSSFHTRK